MVITKGFVITTKALAMGFDHKIMRKIPFEKIVQQGPLQCY
jgi:hypothetical protein